MYREESSLSPRNEGTAEVSWKSVGGCFIGLFQKELQEIAGILSEKGTWGKVFAYYNPKLFRAELVTRVGRTLAEISAHGAEKEPSHVIICIQTGLGLKKIFFRKLTSHIRAEYRDLKFYKR